MSQCSPYDIVVSQENHIMIAKCIYEWLQHIPFWLLKSLRDAKINKNNLVRGAKPSGISLSSLHRARTKQTTKLSSFNLNQNVYEFGMRAIRYDTHSFAPALAIRRDADDTSATRSDAPMNSQFSLVCFRTPIHSGKRSQRKYKYNYAIYLQLDEWEREQATAAQAVENTMWGENFIFTKKRGIFRVFCVVFFINYFCFVRCFFFTNNIYVRHMFHL